jgi:7-keto-8-aminopelargonate synthetase-like enzyme
VLHWSHVENRIFQRPDNWVIKAIKFYSFKMFDEVLFQQRLNDFNPEPLITPVDSKEEDIEIPMVTEDDNNIDLAKVNYLNVLNNDEIKKASEDLIREYGVGTCGPRAFYGNYHNIWTYLE